MASARPSGAVQELLDPAWQMRWRVPELCLMLSDRAVAEARRTGDRGLRLRAEALALFAINRLGRGVSATARAIAAVLEAEKEGEDVAAELRVELATCARWAGSHEVALRVLEPVVELERIDPMVRAHALLELAASLSLRRDGTECADALDEAERMYASVTETHRDTNRLLRARVCTARACHHRRNGESAAALEATVTGLDLVRRLGDPAADSGEVRARLVLEQVHSLLDLGRREEALEAAESVLHQPVRAAAAGPSGWLRLALATRVHLTDGGHATVVMLLNDAVAHAERHKLDGLLAEALSTLSYVHERGADFPQALRCLRNSYSADRRWRAAVQTARVRLLEELPALAGHVSVPSPRSLHADPPSAVAHPALPEPSPAPVDPPVLEEPSWTAGSERRSGGENARDAARRLMETLTQHAASTGDEDTVPGIQPRGSGRSRTAFADSPLTTPESATRESATWESVAGDPEPAVADWTAMLPRLDEPEERTDRGLPSWHADVWDPPVAVTAARQAADLPEKSTTTPGVPTQQHESAPWSSQSTEDTDRLRGAAAQQPRNGSARTDIPAEDEEARVKSLAEIRASLQRIQERSRLKPPAVPDDAGQAWPRHAETAQSATEAADRQTWTRHRELPQDPPTEGTGAEREQVGLADLLAEALVAYETGRRGEEAQRRRAEAAEAGALPEPGFSTRDPDATDPAAAYTNAPRARHRRVPPDQDSPGPQSWTFDRR